MEANVIAVGGTWLPRGEAWVQIITTTLPASVQTSIDGQTWHTYASGKTAGQMVQVPGGCYVKTTASKAITSMIREAA